MFGTVRKETALVDATSSHDRVWKYVYDTRSGLANALSRPSSIREGGTDIATYRYLGLGSVVGEYPEPAVALTYQHAGTGDGGDAYTGLDRFGRITDLPWRKDAAATGAARIF